MTTIIFWYKFAWRDKLVGNKLWKFFYMKKTNILAQCVLRSLKFFVKSTAHNMGNIYWKAWSHTISTRHENSQEKPHFWFVWSKWELVPVSPASNFPPKFSWSTQPILKNILNLSFVISRIFWPSFNHLLMFCNHLWAI